VADGEEIDPGAFFDRNAFMAHHRQRLVKEASFLRASQSSEIDIFADDVSLAPISAKFAENIIHTQLFEAFIEVSSCIAYYSRGVNFCHCYVIIISPPLVFIIITSSPGMQSFSAVSRDDVLQGFHRRKVFETSQAQTASYAHHFPHSIAPQVSNALLLLWKFPSL